MDDGGPSDWYLAGLDIFTGEIQWKRKDYFEPTMWVSDAANFGKTMVKVDPGNGSYGYGINLENGETIWRETRGEILASCFPNFLDGYYYCHQYNGKIPAMYRSNLSTNAHDSITSLAVDSLYLQNDVFGRANTMKIFHGRDEHYFMVIPFVEN